MSHNSMRFNTLSFTLALLLLSGLMTRASAQVDTLWTRIYNLGTQTALTSATELSTGGFVGAGFALTGSSEDAIIVRYNPLGDTAWARLFGDPGTGEHLFDVIELENGNIVACGYKSSGLNSYIVCFSPQGSLLWSREFDWSGADQASALLPMDDGGFFVLARRQVTGQELDFWLIRCDANGDSLFSSTYGTVGTDLPDQILQTPDGNLHLIGVAREPITSQFDVYIVTTNEDGSYIRETTVGGPVWEQAYGATVDTSSGDIIISGEIRPGGQDRDGYAVRLTSSGGLLWEQGYDNANISERFSGVAPFLEGGALLAGQTGGSINAGQLWLVAIAANGDTTWTWSGSETGRTFEDLIRISDGGFIACGRAWASGHDNILMWRISPPSGISGVVRDRVTNEPVAGCRVQAAELPQYSESDTVGRYTLALPPGVYTIYSGGPCFSGDTLHGIEVFANQNTPSDITVGVAHLAINYSTINIVGPNHGQGVADLKFSNSGSGDLVYSFEPTTMYPPEDWLRVEPAQGRVPPGDTIIAQVIIEPDTNNNGTYDYLGELKLHSNSCPDTVLTFEVLAVVLDADDSPALPSEFALYPAYPNPFNSATRLRFGLDHATDVSLRVYDVTGREVAVLLDHSKLSAGEHSLTWNANGLASGLYFVRLSDRARSQTQRLLYIR